VSTSRRRRIPSQRPKRCRVFIFGAGVSASCGIAVANDILRSAVGVLDSADAKSSDRLHDVLHYLYPNFDRQLRNYPNIEDFLNLIEMAKLFNSEEYIASRLWSVHRLDDVKAITLKAVTDYIWGLMPDRQRQNVVRDFVRGQLRRGDTVVTFNWDLLLERALEEYPKSDGFLYGYSRDRKEESFSLLKPHGSIDWFEWRAIKRLVARDRLGKHDDQIYYYPHFDRGATPALANVAPVIVPPVATKRFEFPFLKRTWRSVFRAVSDATELHIIGYSLPREDQFARLVFRRAIRTNVLRASKGKKKSARVIVVNPDPATEGTFARLVGRDIDDFEFKQAYFHDYVAGLDDAGC
jgi:hypothetical protein